MQLKIELSDWTERDGVKMIKADCKDLSGSPVCGFGNTVEEAIRSQGRYNRSGYMMGVVPRIEAILDALELYPEIEDGIHEYYIRDLRKQ